MKQILLICLFILAVLETNAQLGIIVSTTQNQSVEWQVVTENFIVHRRADFLDYGTSGVLDFAFPLKNGVMKIRPAVHFMLSNSVFKNHYFQAGTIGLEGNFEVALTSKLNSQGKRKLVRPYLQLSPGISLASLRYEYPKDDLNNVILVNKSRSLVPSFGAGLFFEVKLTPLLTIAPTVGVRYLPNLRWKGFTEAVTKGSLSNTYDRTNWRQYQFGLRFDLDL